MECWWFVKAMSANEVSYFFDAFRFLLPMWKFSFWLSRMKTTFYDLNHSTCFNLFMTSWPLFPLVLLKPSWFSKYLQICGCLEWKQYFKTPINPPAWLLSQGNLILPSSLWRIHSTVEILQLLWFIDLTVSTTKVITPIDF